MALISHLVAPGPVGGAGFTSPAINTVGADIIIILCTNSAGTISITDSVGNTYVQVASVSNTVAFAQIYYASAHTGAFNTSPSHTFTQNTGGSFTTFFIMAWNGSAASPVDLTASGGNNQASSTQLVPITPSVSGALIVALPIEDLLGSGSSILVDSGLSILDFEAGRTNQTAPSADAYLVQLTAASIGPRFSWTGSATVSNSVMASFLPGGGAGYNTPAPTGGPVAILMGAQVM